jgi:hypothetical protein
MTEYSMLLIKEAAELLDECMRCSLVSDRFGILTDKCDMLHGHAQSCCARNMKLQMIARAFLFPQAFSAAAPQGPSAFGISPADDLLPIIDASIQVGHAMPLTLSEHKFL